MPCDAACIKIIINTGFMATLAPVLAKRNLGGAVAAGKLGIAARVYADMLASVGLKASVEDFKGCDQATLLVAWIMGEQAPIDSELMDKWTADIWSAIADLAAGKLPG